MIALEDIPTAWGKRHFKRPIASLLKGLPLRDEDRDILRTIGLPTGPESAMGMNFRWCETDIVHTPKDLRLLFPPKSKTPQHFPKTGVKALDKWVDLSKFVVLGEVRVNPYSSYAKETPVLAMVCLCGTTGQVVVYYHTKVQPGPGVIEIFGSSLAGYLRSWLAYKQWRETAEDEESQINREKMTKLQAVYDRLGANLKLADPQGFAVKDLSLWEHRSRNLREDLDDDEDDFE